MKSRKLLFVTGVTLTVGVSVTVGFLFETFRQSRADSLPDMRPAMTPGMRPAAAAPGMRPAAMAARRPAEKQPVPVAGAPAVASRSDTLETNPPPFSKGIFPCSQCHEDMELNAKRRTLTEEHKNIVLKHDEKNRWCLDCHNAKDRNVLRLASGKTVKFSESYKLCGQCHGTIYRDWRVGVHGRRKGFWNGKKTYLLCATCHNPHQPKFKRMKPLPPPVRPEEIRP
ncbi:MAG: hypothetical protein ABI333_01570 [bacterium]